MISDESKMRPPLPVSCIRGSVLLYLIAVMTVFGVLGAAMLALSVTTRESAFSAHATNQARFLAESGLRIAQARYCAEGDLETPLTLTLLSGEEVLIEKLPTDVGFSALATAFSGTPLEARAQVFGTLPECGEPIEPGIPGESPDDYVVYTGGGDSGSGSGFVLPSGGNVDGSIFGQKITIQPEVEITENVISSTSVTVGSGSTIGGYICAADGDVTFLSSGSIITGNIYASGNVTLLSNITVLGNIYATGNVSMLNSNGLVNGDIHAGGSFIGSGARVSGSIYAGWNIDLSGTRIDGDLHAGNHIILDGWTSPIAGDSYAGGSRNDHRPSFIQQNPPARMEPIPPTGCPPAPPPPQMQTFTPGTTDFNIPQNASRTVPHGAHRNIIIGNNSTITLRAGNCSEISDPACYVFNSFRVAGGGSRTLRLDFSTGDYISVFCAESIEFTGSIEVSIDGNTYINIKTLYTNSPETARELARRVYWETHTTFTVGDHTGTRQWFGSVLSQNAMFLGSGFFGIGAFATVDGQITITAGSNTIIFEIADFAREHWLP